MPSVYRFAKQVTIHPYYTNIKNYVAGVYLLIWKEVQHLLLVYSVQFSCLVVSDSAIPWTAARPASLSIINYCSLLKLRSIESVMPSNHLILCRPLLLPPSIFPSITVFSKSQFFASSGQILEFQLHHQSFQRTFRTDFL